MPLTRDFKELVRRHVADDPAFAEALLREGINAIPTASGETMRLHQGNEGLQQALVRQRPQAGPHSHKKYRPEDRPKTGRRPKYAVFPEAKDRYPIGQES